jgi:hypothetical protein
VNNNLSTYDTPAYIERMNMGHLMLNTSKTADINAGLNDNAASDEADAKGMEKDLMIDVNS